LSSNAFLTPCGGKIRRCSARSNGVAASVTVLGPYPGQLQHSGELLALKRQRARQATVCHTSTVDECVTTTKRPGHPLADGFGPSLPTNKLGAYGNDPANWLAAAPSFGTDFAGGILPTITVQPASQSVVRFQNALLSVGTSGSAPLRYQWQFLGANLPGATNATLTLTMCSCRRRVPTPSTFITPPESRPARPPC